MTKPSDDRPRCPSCGVPWRDHLGTISLCHNYEEFMKLAIATYDGADPKASCKFWSLVIKEARRRKKAK